MIARSVATGKSSRSPLRVAVAALAAVAVVLLVTAASASAQLPSPATQVATSSDGSYAAGFQFSRDDERHRLPDGGLIEFFAFFSDPGGVVAGGPPSSSFDLTKPFGFLRIEVDRRTGEWGTLSAPSEVLCRSHANPTSYDTGEAVPVEDGYFYGGQDPSKLWSWSGMSFDAECDASAAGADYDFWRVHFKPPPGSHVTWTSPDADAGSTTKVGGGQFGFLNYPLPELELPVGYRLPYGYTGNNPEVPIWGAWGGPTGQQKLGVLSAEPMERQGAEISLCGHREGAAPKCYGDGGTASIVPSSAGLIHTYIP